MELLRKAFGKSPPPGEVVHRCVKRVCVVGAGAAGLIATKALREHAGWEVVTYEGSSRIGGMWSWSAHEDSNVPYTLARHYESLTTNLSSPVMGLSDFQMSPEDYPKALIPHEDVRHFLEAYAAEFSVQDSVLLEHQVQRVAPAGDGSWVVTVKSTGDCQREEAFDAVVVCTGHYGRPFIPHIEGLDSFPGQVGHSQDYLSTDAPGKGMESVRGKRVLVVGCGPSGGEMAAEISAVAEATVISTRRGFLPIPKVDSKTGDPWDHSRTRLSTFLPAWLERYMGKAFVFGPLLAAMRRLGVAAPADSELEELKYATLTVTHSLWRQLKTGKATSNVGGITRIEGRTVYFKDGETFEADTILLCTGYEWAFDFLEDPGVDSSISATVSSDLAVPVVRNRARVDPLHNQVFFCNNPTLAFVGNPVSVFIFPMCEVQAQWIKAYLSGAVTLPAKESMLATRRSALETMCSTGRPEDEVLSKSNKVSHFAYCDGIARKIGWYPSLWTHWRVAWHLLFGPFCAAAYRLNSLVTNPDKYQEVCRHIRAYRYGVYKT